MQCKGVKNLSNDSKNEKEESIKMECKIQKSKK